MTRKNDEVRIPITEPGGSSSPREETPADTGFDGSGREGFPIVGIGASAGGLAAFEAFFSGMPAGVDTRMAFVLVQHLAPDHQSILAELIRRHTRMRVFEVEDGMAVLPNCVYVIPPNRDMAFLNGVLHLMEPSAPRGRRLPIDFFFRSLAQDRRERAVCIVLSGTGNDGTQGVRAVKGEGGMVMAQTPDSAEYDDMPRSAIATGLVDYELAPAEMPSRLAAYTAHAFGALPRALCVPSSRTENVLKKIFILLRSRTGHDFSLYKPDTIRRRIERRLAVHQIETIDGYLRYAQRTPAEVEALFRDLLIGVTGFFRDPEAFRSLEKNVIPRLFDRAPANDAIRVWVPGCSTGEEACSIAILLQERLEVLKREFRVQVFATDIDAQAIAKARAGLYPAGIAASLTPERLARFFTLEPDGNTYRIHKSVRDMLVFSEQDVITDPPFSRIDLISCRNLLIYMGGDLQKRLIPLFHYSLNPDGFLFLGTSETVGKFADLFTVLDRKSKLYRRADGVAGERRAAQNTYLPPLSARGKAVYRNVKTNAFPAKNPASGPSIPKESGPSLQAGAGDGVVGADGAKRETSNEAFKSSNEEMLSVNEELQSTNEELETSREELQSVNEELTTVNSELREKVSALSRANNDMNNLLAGTGIATVFLDPGLRILRYTPTATRIINLIPGDTGRPVDRIASNLTGYDSLAEDVRSVLATLVPKETDVQTKAGTWYSMHILPYRTLENIIEGAVITFVDITEIVRTREALRKANDLTRMAVVVRDAYDAIIVQDIEGRILAWNPGAVKMYGWSEAEALEMNVRDRMIPDGLQEEAFDRVHQLCRAEILEPYRTQRITREGAVVNVWVTATALVDADDRMYAIATTERADKNRRSAAIQEARNEERGQPNNG